MGCTSFFVFLRGGGASRASPSSWRLAGRMFTPMDNSGGAVKARINRLRSTTARICHHSAAARSLRNRLDQLFAYELAGKKHLPLVLDSRFRAVYFQIATASLDLECGEGGGGVLRA